METTLRMKLLLLAPLAALAIGCSGDMGDLEERVEVLENAVAWTLCTDVADARLDEALLDEQVVFDDWQLGLRSDAEYDAASRALDEAWEEYDRAYDECDEEWGVNLEGDFA